MLIRFRKKTCSKVPTSAELIFTNTCIIEKDRDDSNINVTALVFLPFILEPPSFGGFSLLRPIPSFLFGVQRIGGILPPILCAVNDENQ